MKANELRYGNIVEFKKYGIRPVYQIRVDGVFHFSSEFATFDQIDPVSITEEKLIYAGFKFLDNVTLSIDLPRQNAHIECRKEDDGYLFTYMTSDGCDTLNKTINYVHELQNLYYCLTGEELIVV